MRAQTIDFKRGIGSKEALNLGIPRLKEFEELMKKINFIESEQQEADTPNRKTLITYLPANKNGTRDFTKSEYFEIYKDLNNGEIRVNYEDSSEVYNDLTMKEILDRKKMYILSSFSL